MRIVLGSEYPGLGDNLQMSTIPEIAKSLGYEVYVSKQNKYRDKDTIDLVWHLNPYIDGFVDEPTTIKWNEYKHVHGQVVKDVEHLVFGKAYTDGTPKLYLPEHITVPSNESHYRDRVVIDPNGWTQGNLPESVFENYDNPILLNYEKEGYETINTYAIIYWVMAIVNCKKFVCANSGGSVVAAALGKKADVYFKNQITHYKFNHKYIPL
jgi:hypothetical protein